MSPMNAIKFEIIFRFSFFSLFLFFKGLQPQPRMFVTQTRAHMHSANSSIEKYAFEIFFSTQAFVIQMTHATCIQMHLY